MSMMSPKGPAVAAVTLLVLFVIVMPSPVSAQKSLECQKVWKGPSANNKMFDCVKSSEHIKGQLGFMVLPLLNALLLIGILLGFPISVLIMFLCFDYFEQTSKKNRADSQGFIWMWIAYAVLWGCCMVILVIHGAKMLIKYSPSIFENTLDGPLVYFNETAEKIIDFTSNWTTGERVRLSSFQTTIAPLTMVQAQVKAYVELFRKNALAYVDKLALVSYCISTIGLAFILSLLPLGFFRCSSLYISIGFSCVYWLFGIFFAIFGLSMNVLSVYLSAGCGEVELQQQRKPGVFQWYLVPSCQRMLKMNEIRAQVRNAEYQYSKEGCMKLLKACDDKDPDLSSKTQAPKSNPAGNKPTGSPAGKPKTIKAREVQLYSPYLNSEDTVTRDKLRITLGGVGVDKGGKAGGSGNTLGGVLGTAIATSKKNGGAPVRVKLPKSFDKFKIYKGLNSSQVQEKLQNALQQGFDINTIASIATRPFICGKNITSGDQCSDFDTMADILIASTVKKVTSMCPRDGETCTILECSLHCKNEEFKVLSKRIVEAALMARNASIAISYVRPLLECNFIIDKFSVAFANCNDLGRGTLLLGMGFFVGGLMFGLAIYIMLRGSCVWKTPKEKKDDKDPKEISGTRTNSNKTSPSVHTSHATDEPEEKQSMENEGCT
ncbi:hypothetical protein LSM04_005742 [Trypanosoma melophagium]|uniref:uncharacterized protein n=1 Tax=Trypanosoma melophagium TaxID=715481 RepID=UPI00351A025E|nr:hypothetical protein LSM04_005742 [Trypanosoma melophagium]